MSTDVKVEWADWQRAAIDAAERADAQNRADREELEREHFDSLAGHLLTGLGRLGVPAERHPIVRFGDSPAVVVDGTTFTLVGCYDRPAIVRACPRCGEPALGSEIDTTVELGRRLLDWRPSDYHHCPKPSPDPVAAQTPERECTPVEARLLDALRDWWGEEQDR